MVESGRCGRCALEAADAAVAADDMRLMREICMVPHVGVL